MRKRSRYFIFRGFVTSPEQVEKIEREAARFGLNQSQLIRNALDFALASEDFRGLKP